MRGIFVAQWDFFSYNTLKWCWNLLGFISSNYCEIASISDVEVNLIPQECIGLFQYVRIFPWGKGRATEQKCNIRQDTKVKKGLNNNNKSQRRQGLFTRSNERVGSTTPSRKPWTTWPESWQELWVQPSSCGDNTLCQRTGDFNLQGTAQTWVLQKFSQSTNSVDVSACPNERVS